MYYYQSGFQQIGPNFKNRLNLLSTLNTTMNASISITNMQVADAGMYTCEVHNPPDIDGTTSATIRVNVLGNIFIKGDILCSFINKLK